MSLAKLLAAAACSVLLVRPTQAVVLGARQDLPEALQGPALPLSPLLPRPPPTVTVTTQLSVTVTATTDTPRAPPPTDSASAAFPTALPAPSSGDSPTGGTAVGPGAGTGAETTVNDMPTATGTLPTATDSSQGTGSLGGDSDGIGSNRTLVITLSTVLSVVGLLLIIGAVLACRRYRKGRFPFARGISPIDDDEIATWKVPRSEKAPLTAGDAAAGGLAGTVAGATVTMVGAAAGRRDSSEGPSHSKHASTSSIKKPPSVIVYSGAHGQGYRESTDNSSPRSFISHDSGHAGTPPYKMSFEKVLPPPPVQAKAPNARVGLTDESIPGDEPFLPSPRRQTSRLSKLPPGLSPSQRRTHLRTRSSRSSTRSFGDYAYGGSDLGLSQRHSHDYIPRSHGHWRVYSSSSIPPRLSFSDDSVFNGGLSPRPLLADQEIGRAIG